MSYKNFTANILQSDVQFLKDMGLESHHKILDVGCAGGRLGYELINYLDKDGYYGFDKETKWIESFRLSVLATGLSNGKNPTIELGDFTTSFPDIKFDYVYAYSLFTHIDPPLVTQFFDNFKDNIVKETKIFATLTVLEGEGWEIRGGRHEARKNEFAGVYYSLDFFNNLIEKSGYRIVTDNVKEHYPTSLEIVGPLSDHGFTLDGTGTHRMILMEKIE